jgi:hypothetical protein
MMEDIFSEPFWGCLISQKMAPKFIKFIKGTKKILDTLCVIVSIRTNYYLLILYIFFQFVY